MFLLGKAKNLPIFRLSNVRTSEELYSIEAPSGEVDRWMLNNATPFT